MALYEYGDSAPVLVCVHGYPDNATVEPGRGQADGPFRVITYDVNGPTCTGERRTEVLRPEPRHRRTGAGGVAGRRPTHPADRWARWPRTSACRCQGRALVAPE